MGELLRLRSDAQTVAEWCRRQRESLALQNEAAEVKLRAERRLGEMLKDMPKNKGACGTGSNQHEVRLHDETTPHPITLAELGIEKTRSHRCQRLAAMPEGDFERHIADKKAAGLAIPA